MAEMRQLGVSSDSPPSIGEGIGKVFSSFKEKIKIMITHYQISLSLNSTLDFGGLNWNIFGFASNFSFVKLDFMDLMRMECIQPVNAYDALFASGIGATTMLLAIPLTSAVLLGKQTLSWRWGWSEQTLSDVRTRIHFTNRAWSFGLGLCFFFFPPISERAFQTMHCTEMEPGKQYLYSDLSVVCWDSTHIGWFVFSCFIISIYTVGIPIAFWWILYSNQRKLVLQTPRVSGRFGFLYSKYRDDVWYWELAEMFRKLIFTSIIMFFATGTAVQICYAMFIAFVFLIAHINKKAYKERSDFQIQTVSMICIFLTLWLGLMMRTGVVVELDTPGNEMMSKFFRALTVIVQMMPLLSTLIAFLGSIWKVLSALVMADFCPDFGCESLGRLFSGGGSMADQQSDMLSLAMAVNTAEAGDAVAAACYRDPNEAKVETRQTKKAEKQQKKLEQLTIYTRESAGVHHRQSLEGNPVVVHEKFRKLFLKHIQLTQTAIILRHWPVGKGFIIRVPKAMQSEYEEGRPPYLFIKVWSIKNVDAFVDVTYDVRDVGEEVCRDDVIFFPDDVNKQLLLYEHAKKIADGRLPPPRKPVKTIADAAAAVDTGKRISQTAESFKDKLKSRRAKTLSESAKSATSATSASGSKKPDDSPSEVSV